MPPTRGAAPASRKRDEVGAHGIVLKLISAVTRESNSSKRGFPSPFEGRVVLLHFFRAAGVLPPGRCPSLQGRPRLSRPAASGPCHRTLSGGGFQCLGGLLRCRRPRAAFGASGPLPRVPAKVR